MVCNIIKLFTQNEGSKHADYPDAKRNIIIIIHLNEKIDQNNDNT